MIAVIDIGNTRAKLAVFHQNSLLEQWQCNVIDIPKKVLEIFKKHPNISIWVGSQVSNNEPEIAWLNNHYPTHWFEREQKFPFTNLYQTPETLGLDRMVLASGTVLSYPEQAVLVIDMGTCITFDFVDAERNYHGGAIAPGMQMRYQMMHEKTAKLPLLSPQFLESVFGKTTEQSMHIGVTTAICSEIDSYVDRIQKVYGNFTIILTGGDAVFFAKKLKSAIFANSNFLLESLYHLYLYQISNDQSF